MKRSEMLKQITNVLLELSNTRQAKSEEVIAEELLSLVEKSGMLPPNSLQRGLTKENPADLYLKNKWEEE